nr:MAG TPA: abiotic ATP-binding protein [Bacteriophage sp.]
MCYVTHRYTLKPCTVRTYNMCHTCDVTSKFIPVGKPYVLKYTNT